MNKYQQKFSAFARRLSTGLLVIFLALSIGAPVYAQDIFYFLEDNTVKLYNRDGIFQKSYPLPEYEDSNASGIATDGVKVWISYSFERKYIDRMPLATAPVLDGGIPWNNNPSAGYGNGVAISNGTVYLSRSLNATEAQYSLIENYNDSTGAYNGGFSTGTYSFPSSMQVVGGTIFVRAGGDKIRRYSLSGHLDGGFDLYTASDPIWDVSGICADDNYVWAFGRPNYNRGYAYTHAGVRVPAQDIVFGGLTRPRDCYIAPSPSGQPDISIPESNLDFGSVNTGESADLELIVQNVGDADLNITGGTLSDPTNFSHTVTAYVLPPGTSHTFSVTYTPATTGEHNATLSILSDDPDEATFNVTLSGVGESGSGCSKTQFYFNVIQGAL